jgi:hypothetical protein
MRHWLPLLLSLAALLGLLGQEAALAHAMPTLQTEVSLATSEMDSDCAEMMGHAKQPEPAKPCQDMTFDCIAKMGCTTTVALPPDRTLAEPQPVRPAVPPQLTVVPLVGFDLGPEPHPPAYLG